MLVLYDSENVLTDANTQPKSEMQIDKSDTSVSSYHCQASMLLQLVSYCIWIRKKGTTCSSATSWRRKLFQASAVMLRRRWEGKAGLGGIYFHNGARRSSEPGPTQRVLGWDRKSAWEKRSVNPSNLRELVLLCIDVYRDDEILIEKR